MNVYYNEFDKKKCAALKELMADGLISAGDIDDRPIQEVKANDLQGYTRCHFFAGIGLWDYALQLAGWEADRPVWTGSCPCQPFSSAGRQKGKDDDRHLWPEWERLIRGFKPTTIFGEQVSSAIAKGWLDDVYQGLEAENYAVGSAVLPACSVGAPHKRDRLWFVADSEGAERARNGAEPRRKQNGFTDSSAMGNAEGAGRRVRPPENKRAPSGEIYASSNTSGSSFWQNSSEWLNCPDGKERLIEPGIRLLADGYPNRVLQLHCAGDGIVPQVAAEFITAFMEAQTNETR